MGDINSSIYHAYLLRFWPDGQQAEKTCWRFALLDPKTGEQAGFASLEALVEHLSSITENSAPAAKL